MIATIPTFFLKYLEYLNSLENKKKQQHNKKYFELGYRDAQRFQSTDIEFYKVKLFIYLSDNNKREFNSLDYLSGENSCT